MIRNAWYVAGFSQEFQPGTIAGQVIAGRPLVLWRTRAGEAVALDARCAHKRFPLWHGRLLDGDVLECAYHGFAYDPSGRCVAIPALHEQQEKIPQTARQHRFPVREQDGVVWLWPGDREPPASPPPTPEIGASDWETIRTEPMEVAANARLLIENLFDLTHFYPLHAGNIGSLADAQVPVEIERGERDGIPYLKTIRRRSNFALPPMTRDRFGLQVADQAQEHEMVGPGLFHVVVRVAPPGELGSAGEQGFVLYQSITPQDESHHIWRRSISCRAGTRWAGSPGRSLLEAIVAGAPTVIAQDRWAIEEQQKMFAYPDEGYREVHIKTDGAVVMARQILDDLEAAEGSAGLPQVRTQRARRSADVA
ncbi:MAG: aromatic ring-hydroxylating dioxygenase subunit alpha [Actinomycetota bacterium]|nr:aromatic ring-hydroxylating dioxygenase subunit alpha [Actinomycetota bacterium]